VVDRRRQPGEELREAVQIGGVERRGARRADLAGRLLQPLLIAAGDDDVGTFGAGQAGGLEPDPGAAADDDDGLPGECAAQGDPAPTGAAISAFRALSAPT
jgi:hypothetical protein